MKKQKKSGHCVKCGVFRSSLHRDHIFPKWQGGLDEEINVQYICANCHEDKTLAELRSPEYAIWQAQTSRKRWEDAAMRKKTQDAMQGVPKSAETRERMSETAKKYRATDEGKKALDEAREHVKEGWTPEARLQHSELNKKRLEDPGEYAKHCAINRGRKWSDEERAEYSRNRTGRKQPRKIAFKSLSPEHVATIVEGKKRRREFIATLTSQQKAEFNLENAERALAKLRLQVSRQQEIDAEKETVQ